MKVGTDGVLLGCWADLSDAERLLDIGTGSGVIAVIACQRNSRLEVDAIELDPAAATQAADNFSNSPWPNRLHAIRGDIRILADNGKNTYDHIICNPPFYPSRHHSRSRGASREMARSSKTLELIELARAVDQLLAAGGVANLILPVREAEQFVEIMMEAGLMISRKCVVHPAASKPAHRWLMEFKKISLESVVQIKEERLVIQASGKRNDFTSEYIGLTKDFYTIL